MKDKICLFEHINEAETEEFTKGFLGINIIERHSKKIKELKLKTKKQKTLVNPYSDIKLVHLPNSFYESKNDNSFCWNEFTVQLISNEIINMILNDEIQLSKDIKLYKLFNGLFKWKNEKYILTKKSNLTYKNWIQQGIINSVPIKSNNKDKSDLDSILKNMVTFYLKSNFEEFAYQKIIMSNLRRVSENNDWISINLKEEKGVLNTRVLWTLTKDSNKIDKFKIEIENIESRNDKAMSGSRETANFKIFLMEQLDSKIKSKISSD